MLERPEGSEMKPLLKVRIKKSARHHHEPSTEEVSAKKTRRRKIKLVSECSETFKCSAPGCYLRFDTEIRRDAHFLRKHKGDPRPFKCQTCEQSFMFQEKLVAHKMAHAGLKPFMCEYCGRSYRREGAVKSHQLRHCQSIPPELIEGNPSAKREYPCETCGKILSSVDNLRKHIDELHSRLFRFLCEPCSSAFLRRNDLKNHQFRFHADIFGLADKPEFHCKICGKFFPDKHYLRRHEQLHTGESVPFHCTVCSYKCFGQHRFRLHMAAHENLRIHRCDFPGCSKSYNNKYRLIKHKLVHTGERLGNYVKYDLYLNFVDFFQWSHMIFFSL